MVAFWLWIACACVFAAGAYAVLAYKGQPRAALALHAASVALTLLLALVCHGAARDAHYALPLFAGVLLCTAADGLRMLQRLEGLRMKRLLRCAGALLYASGCGCLCGAAAQGAPRAVLFGLPAGFAAFALFTLLTRGRIQGDGFLRPAGHLCRLLSFAAAGCACALALLRGGYLLFAAGAALLAAGCLFRAFGLYGKRGSALFTALGELLGGGGRVLLALSMLFAA